MRLSARSEYGLLAMIDLAARTEDGPVSAREISETQAIPAKFLEQLLVKLRQGGLISSVRGAHGGFVMDKDPESVTVLEIVEALEGPLVSTVCDGERSAVCGRNGICAAADIWGRATDALREVFESTTLDDLVRRQRTLDMAEESSAGRETG